MNKKRKLVYETPKTMESSGGAVNSITIPNLAGKFAEYEIEGVINIAGSSTGTWLLARINGDSGNNYTSFEKVLGISTGLPLENDPAGNPGGQSGMNLARSVGTGSNDIDIKGKIYNPPQDNTVRFRSENNAVESPSRWVKHSTSGIYLVNAEIVTITLLADQSKTWYGKLRVYKVMK